MRAMRQLEMSKRAVSAEAFRVARPALKALKAQGMQLQRIQPADPTALIKPWHANLPVGSMGPGGVSNVRGNVVQVAKGKLRTPEMPGGTNYPLSTLAHEAGHWQHDKVNGIFQPRLPGRPLPEQHPMRYLETPVRELQANNTANQMLNQYGASPQAQQWYNGTRADSFKSHLVHNYHRMAALPAEMRAAPDFQRYRDAWKEVASQPGYTPSFSVKNDLPSVRQMTQGFTAGNTKMANSIMRAQHRLQLAEQMRKRAYVDAALNAAPSNEGWLGKGFNFLTGADSIAENFSSAGRNIGEGKALSGVWDLTKGFGNVAFSAATLGLGGGAARVGGRALSSAGKYLAGSTNRVARGAGAALSGTGGSMNWMGKRFQNGTKGFSNVLEKTPGLGRPLAAYNRLGPAKGIGVGIAGGAAIEGVEAGGNKLKNWAAAAPESGTNYKEMAAGYLQPRFDPSHAGHTDNPHFGG